MKTRRVSGGGYGMVYSEANMRKVETLVRALWPRRVTDAAEAQRIALELGLRIGADGIWQACSEVESMIGEQRANR